MNSNVNYATYEAWAVKWTARGLHSILLVIENALGNRIPQRLLTRGFVERAAAELLAMVPIEERVYLGSAGIWKKGTDTNIEGSSAVHKLVDGWQPPKPPEPKPLVGKEYLQSLAPGTMVQKIRQDSVTVVAVGMHGHFSSITTGGFGICKAEERSVCPYHSDFTAKDSTIIYNPTGNGGCPPSSSLSFCEFCFVTNP